MATLLPWKIPALVEALLVMAFFQSWLDAELFTFLDSDKQPKSLLKWFIITNQFDSDKQLKRLSSVCHIACGVCILLRNLFFACRLILCTCLSFWFEVKGHKTKTKTKGTTTKQAVVGGWGGGG